MRSAISPEGWGCERANSAIMRAQPVAHANLAAFFAVFVVGNNLLESEVFFMEWLVFKEHAKACSCHSTKTNPDGVPEGCVYT